MKTKELRSKDNQDLRDIRTTLSEEIFKLRFEKSVNMLKNTARLSTARRELARVTTLLSEQAKQANKG
jgi:large subunit ribosomal protein L29